MRAVLFVLVVATGCNQLFGLEAAVLWDGAPPDVPAECPPLGMVPTFSGVFVESVPRNCTDYSLTTTGRAVAACFDSNEIEEGAVDGTLMPTGIGNPLSLSWPRVNPEGDEVYVIEDSTKLTVFTKQGTTWVRGPTVFSVTSGSLIGATPPSRRPDRRMGVLVATYGSMHTMVELADSGSGWVMQGQPYSPSELGGATLAMPFMSDDGLRLIFSSVTSQTVLMKRVMYADRERITDRFRGLGEMMGVPRESGYAHMTADCGRFYVSRGDAIIYAPR